jgi:hypothetical protein
MAIDAILEEMKKDLDEAVPVEVKPSLPEFYKKGFYEINKIMRDYVVHLQQVMEWDICKSRESTLEQYSKTLSDVAQDMAALNRILKESVITHVRPVQRFVIVVARTSVFK